MSRKVIDGPLRHLAWVLGGIALVATVLGLEAFADVGPQAKLGRGGIERWIAYPVLLFNSTSFFTRVAPLCSMRAK